ncbi:MULTISPECIES: AfsR/SARP family transcriptional regulator [unclassified Amycolatopsis]|uniref:AfsR/SARP family transcriptional regulator n=1 Tax=unclassified Amycolatopsis TaxID=2618356 RepID=UPI002E1314C2|nr:MULTISPECIES: AfsR/SARP family transcriptional regulator [unclassified Amycolatopsis]WSJ81182.1 AfsR/SARP family transcriptional regulator [Amycolatopsis sp. NBC_01307]WSK75385.1 AfsR/SARP family transcriptional regulator [Amycolatopsis sp. NBC_01286]
MLELSLLGPLRVESPRGEVRTTSTKIRQVLALLALESPSAVGIDRIIHELWPQRPPKSAVGTIQTYVYHLRKQLAEHVGCGTKVLATVTNGYLLSVDPDAIDARRFEQVVREGRVVLDAGHAAEASRKMEEALAMWHGAALADVRQGPSLDAEAVRLEGLREAALELRVQADLEQEHLPEVIPELQALIRRYPLRERFHHQLVSALNRAGRRADALSAYRHTCRVLNEELGLDPSDELRRLHQIVLTGQTRTPALEGR